MMRKTAVFLLCMVILVFSAACGSTRGKNRDNTAENGSQTEIDSAAREKDGTLGAQISNPFSDCDTIEEACRQVGFDITIPDKAAGYSEKKIQTASKEDMKMIQVFYMFSGEEKILIRKAVSSTDISGDFTDYEEEDVVSAGGRDVTLKGNDGTKFLAVWTDKDYSYSVHVSDGMESDSMMGLIELIN
ncbi:hypothetical protein [Qiania dongpingensis]|uniref:DUF4367 domain-containing protein n=1 Tax=Qiania dongpingensis TaxID=2763669 RepID=A0A7G9G2W8_9FIRM|nr:hypothetical protein [Qiania dongpingensis]QNM05150.1 hypothetical protein H9Q78_11970 [Qiania dongpingensis]